MAKKMYVVYCEDDGTYWCGLNTWDKQLRKAKVFHWLKYANEVHERYKKLKLKNVEIRMELVPENPTNADRIRAMTDEELIAFFVLEDKCPPERYSSRACDGHDSCKDCWIDWLKQPAEGDA